jgi:hypothetical protein
MIPPSIYKISLKDSEKVLSIGNDRPPLAHPRYKNSTIISQKADTQIWLIQGRIQILNEVRFFQPQLPAPVSMALCGYYAVKFALYELF